MTSKTPDVEPKAAEQVGGDYYRTLKPEPFEVIDAWGLDFYLGNALECIARASRKNASQELLKGARYLREAAARAEREEKAQDVARDAFREIVEKAPQPPAPLPEDAGERPTFKCTHGFPYDNSSHKYCRLSPRHLSPDPKRAWRLWRGFAVVRVWGVDGLVRFADISAAIEERARKSQEAKGELTWHVVELGAERWSLFLRDPIGADLYQLEPDPTLVGPVVTDGSW